MPISLMDIVLDLIEFKLVASTGKETIVTLHGDFEIDAYPPPSEDAEQLCALRRKLGLSISEGARRVGINFASYCNLEQGRATADWDTVRMLLQENV